MKSAKNLFKKMMSTEHIRKCIMKASLGKRNRDDVKRVLNNMDDSILEIQESIQDGTYADNIPHHIPFKINDGVTRKVRYIVKPDFFEQIVHHMIISVIKDKIMSGMYKYNCGSIPKRGGTYAKRVTESYIKKHLKDGKINYCLKLDVHHFFQSIHHLTLKKLIMKNIKDPEVVNLLDVTIEAYHDHENDAGDKCGIPIGFYTSQWLANWYLQGLDHYIKQDLKAGFYVRYMDDMVIFGESKDELHDMLNKIVDYLEKIGLKLNSKWQIFPFDNRITKSGKHLKKGRCVDFVGFRFYRDRVILRKNLMLRGTRKAKKIYKQKDCNWYEATQLISSCGWFGNSNSGKLVHDRVEPYVNIGLLKRKISKHKRKQNMVLVNKMNEILKKKGVAVP